MNNQSTKHSAPRPFGRGRGEGLLLLLLLMFCSMTTAWAGAGLGTFNDPYSGQWDCATLGAKLMAGDYLKYDCKIEKSGGIYVTDIKLKSQVVKRWSEWAVADPIDDSPWSQYSDYDRYNPEKKNQLFLVTEVKYTNSELYIKGCYTGHYDRGDGSKDNPYWGEWKVAELAPRLKSGDYLAYDCEVIGSVNVIDIKLNKTSYMDGMSWPVGKSIDINGLHVYNDYIKTWNSEEDRRHQMFIVSNVNVRGEKSATISGNYTGTYPDMLDADGYYEVGSFYGLKKAIELGGANAKIKLTNDIYIPSSGDNTLSSGTFSGQISGLCYVPDMVTGAMKAGTFAIHGTSNPTQKECNGAFFNALKGAKLEYLTFTNMSIPKISGDNWGLICRTAENTHFRNIIIQNVDVFGNNDNIGLVAGKATKCMFEVVSIYHSTVKAYGQYAGGLVGRSDESTYQNCMTDMASGVWADGTFPNAYVGGMVGYSVKDDFNSCLNSASVGAYEDEVGGFVGYSNYSKFTACNNVGQVVHCDENEFSGMITKIRDALRRITVEDIEKYNTAVELAAGVPGLFLGMITGTFASFGTAILLGYISCAIIETCGMAIVAIVTTAVFIVTYYAVTWAFDQFSMDDELGGIAGRAEGGSFEGCWNSGHLVCKQSYGGGIVGIGKGVTINNCMNSDNSDFDRGNCGSIIGQACSYDGHKTKVTNCFSEADYPVIGDPNGEVDGGSSYNYRHYKGKSGRRGTNEYEEEVSDKIVKSGILTQWLNNSAVNRAAGVRPWRQNLESMKTLDETLVVDEYPTLDASHHEVTSQDIPLDYRISNADDLIAFATAVNGSSQSDNSGQFLRAVLTADIDMTGYKWTPVGKDEANKHFRGVFDGQGHTIKGLKCNAGDKAVGLFGAVHSNAEIRNVIIADDCEFTSTGDLGAGAIVGTADINWKWGNVVVENCGNYGKVNGKNNAGGIFGRMKGDMGEAVKAYINNCFSVGTITAEQGNSGLIGGYMRDNAVITNCWSAGKLVSSTWDRPFDDAHHEFFAGYDNNIDIKNCYAINPTANVQGAGMATIQGGVSNQQEIVLATGKLTYMLNGEKGKGAWQQNLGTDAHPMLGGNGLSHSRSLVNNSYGTVCLPYSLQSDDNVALYTFNEATDDGNTVTLSFTRTETVEPGTPALFVVLATDEEYSFADSADGEYMFIPGSSEKSTDWTFKGTYDYLEFEGADAKDKYVISENMIKNNTYKIEVPNFRAYFSGPDISELDGKTITLVIDGDVPTALQLIGDDLVPVQKNGKTYTLMGTEVGKGYKGIVIQGGRKYVRK